MTFLHLVALPDESNLVVLVFLRRVVLGDVEAHEVDELVELARNLNVLELSRVLELVLNNDKFTIL